ncbi:Rha family transcriptional regulator [Vreelandella aquamarina]|uniref:Rha family transcriptional regulator n=1 Tax=Vreelandella aquamarina TaxID=77097 RepID=UPI00078308AD|nr:Rha family transcriptional regulator [Halomonas axialensis]
MSMPMEMPALTMSSRDIAELVESRHDKVKQSIERLAERGLITFTPVGEKSTGGRPATVYRVGKRDSYVIVAQLSPEFTARLVDRWQELEEQAAKPSLPDFSDPIAAAEAWIEAKKAEQAAIATKAEIGSRREATAMATASAASRRAAKLERDLDRSKDYCTIKRMSMLTHGQKYNWRLLKSASQDLGIPAIDVFDANYGTVKAYHADVWMEAYGLEVAA